MNAKHILNLGAGVQSTTLYLMFLRGEIPVQLDCAIFADTGEEPKAVYEHLRWLQSLNGPPIIVRGTGKLGDDLKNGKNSTGQRFASIPAFTLYPRYKSEDYDEDDQRALDLSYEDVEDFTDPDVPLSLRVEHDRREVGQTQRQCSKEYKVEVIERYVRREVYGLSPGKRLPKDNGLTQYVGISMDEAGRASRLSSRRTLGRMCFPLIDRHMTRTDCIAWLKARGSVPHEVPRSACVFCPYHSDAEWLRVRAVPEDWSRAVEVDEALRTTGSVANRGIDAPMFVHRSCQPLQAVTFQTRKEAEQETFAFWRDDSFSRECLGVCGL